jgi:predicted nucleic acid-binding protein
VIVLDTNVISALMRRDSPIVDWLDEQQSESVWTTSITVYEVRFGIELLALGRRRTDLERNLERLIYGALKRRVLPFDMAAASAAAAIASRQRSMGRPVEIRDVQIAGTVACRKATLATRNVRHFAQVGLSLIDPWSV